MANKLQWVPMAGGKFPSNSFEAGLDGGKKLYVARANHQGEVIPGKLHDGHNNVYIPHNMKEVSVQNYEVLVAQSPSVLSWVEGQNGSVPQNAVVGGKDAKGETLYIGRVMHKNRPLAKCILVTTYNGEELSFKEYEILKKNHLGVMLNV